jgi:PAS domain S-box-containing protein
MRNQQNNPLIKKQPLLVLSLAIFIVIISGGYFYYRYETKIIRQEQYSDLKTIADVKINQILEWREDRLADAQVISESSFIRLNFQRWLISKDSTLEKNLLERFSLLRYNYKYENVFVVSAGGKLLLDLNASIRHIDSETIDYCNKALQGKKAFLSDFYFSPAHDTIHFDVFAPILSDRNVPVAVLVLHVNPYDYLYPLIQSWPTSSKSAETLIIRRDGDSILYENELRHISNTALKLRIPLTSIEVPAVQAVLGQEGIFEGSDYRGVKVLADIRPVPGTPWFMIAKVDQSEIFSELRYRTVIVIIISLLLLLFFGIGISWVYNIRQRNIYRKLLETGTSLQESQEEFRTTLYSIGDAVITTDIKGCIRNMNVVAEKLTGWKESEGVGRSIIEVFHIVNEESREKVEGPVQRVIKEGLVVGLANHTLLISKDGKEIPIADSGAPIRNEKGDISGVVLVFRDQTQERAAQKALQESERKFHEAVKYLDQGYYSVTTDGLLIDHNQAYNRILGIDINQELKGQKTPDFWQDPEDRKQYLNELMIHGSISNFQAKAKKINGENIVVLLNSHLVKDENDKLLRIEGTVTDFTRMKLMEEALEGSEIKYRTLFENSQVGMYRSKIDGSAMLDVNKKFGEILGLTREEALGKAGRILWANPEDRDKMMKLLKEQGGILYNYEARLLANNGEVRDVLASIELDHDKGSLDGTFVDITERKRAEEQLCKLNRIYSLLSDIYQAIVRMHVPMELYGKVCDIAVEQGGFGMAWIGLIDESSQELRVIAQAGRNNGYNEQVNISLKGKPLNYCPIDSALRQEKHIICKIIENEKMAPCQKIAFDLGFRSSASFPLKVSGILKGALTFYSDEPDFFDEAELKLLDELAMDISFAMEYTEKEAGRKQAETMLREEKDRIRNILDLVGDPIFVKDNDHRITLANRAFYDIFCLNEKSVIGYTLVEAVPVNERQHFLEVDRRVLDTGITDIREEELTVKGLTRTIITRKKCFTDESGKRFLVGSIHDITDRKLAELELRESEARYKTLVENIPQKIFMKSRDFKWMSINENFARDLGISPEEIVGKLDRDLFSIELADKYHADDERIITNGKTEELEEKYVVDGKESWVNTIKTPVRDKTGEIVGVLGIFWDITGRKLAEEEIRKLNTELEDRVTKRTAQLEASNKELEAFSYSVSHDLRAPLRHVSGYVELLNKNFQTELTEKGQHYLNSIADSVHIMGMLIDDLLQFSRTGRLEMHQSDFDMNEVVKDVIESQRKDNPDRKIEWVVGELASVYGDEAMLRVVWTNLLSNAVKFTRTRKKARIEIDVRKENKELVFFVRDNGVGFDMQYAQKLFGVFQRLHPTEEFEGTGIGLANVQRIISRQGGRTWAEAELDKGAIFYFSIPKNKEEI